jgi:SulP family sulfate permease
MKLVIIPLLSSLILATIFGWRVLFRQRAVFIVDGVRDFYRLAWLSKDSIAGLSACIVSIPSVIAYAELVHLPPIAGLYAALAAAIGYALFSSSRHVIAGPDAAIGLLAGSAILPLAGGDPARIVVLAAVLSILSGRSCCCSPRA